MKDNIAITTQTNISIDKIIEDLKELYNSKERINFRHEGYLNFKNELTSFIYFNHLENTKEWDCITNNLVYTSRQYMVQSEADTILLQLEKMKLLILQKENEYFWEYVHKTIKDLVFVKFNSEQYADAVESAFKEINSRLKKIYRKYYKQENSNKELDGKNLMEYLFSLQGNRLKFEDTFTESGENVQVGYMQIFSGAISGIRNPKAHENMKITRDSAIKRLIFASLLMDKIDEAINYNNLIE